MKRMKRHKVKTEVPETSTSYGREQEVHDLAYYIHDRVELMHQVFSVIKYKELKAMAPACIRNISIDDLQELCTEELLGISSKRLCAILDGADPPSDTESSSPSPPPEQMETISLDSISSDEEILSQSSSRKKKHKHRRHSSKSKSKHKKSKDPDDGEADRSKASRAGLTVLELLELQARARAIRAQLQNEQQNKPQQETSTNEPRLSHSSDNEVEIKEEPAEVVEILSSDDEKPKVEELNKKISQEKSLETPQQSTTVTKRVHDLIVTVPQKSKQKIKLNRNKSIPAADTTNNVASTQNIQNESPDVATTKNVTPNAGKNKDSDSKKEKSKKKKKDKKRVSNKDDIDNDEITLQLSDTEKMDLLEDLDRKHYDSVSSCSDSSTDSSSDSDDSQGTNKVKDKSLKEEEITPGKSKDKNTEIVSSDTEKRGKDNENVRNNSENTEKVTSETGEKGKTSERKDSETDKTSKNKENESETVDKDTENTKDIESNEKVTSEPETEDLNKETSPKSVENNNINNEDDNMEAKNRDESQMNKEITEKTTEIVKINTNKEDTDTTVKDISSKEKDSNIKDIERSQSKDSDKKMSEGELSDRESSEIEALDFKPEVVCISDEEGGKKSKKKKSKKDKKSKKVKKSKKSKKSDFRESSDQNFYKDNIVTENSPKEINNTASIKNIDNAIHSDSSLTEPPITQNLNTLPSTEIIDKVDLTDTGNTELKTIDKNKTDSNSLNKEKTIDISVKSVTCIESTTNNSSDDDIQEIIEILELSDDSCCEVECTILSKEPTTQEIEALSAKIDEFDRVEVITEKEIQDYENREDSSENIENISWKDRYLDSKKVKKVLTTAYILNALRKKNIDLKKKLAESTKIDDIQENIEETENKEIEQNILEEGSIEQYNTLQGLTKYVDPVKEVPKDLKKDAKLLLKMYKKLLKYNDMNKQENTTKKKSKKSKKKTKNKKAVENVVSTKSVVSTKNIVLSENVTCTTENDIITNENSNLELNEKDVELHNDTIENL